VAGDINGDGAPDLSDAIYLVTWLFRGGPEPVPSCDVSEPLDCIHFPEYLPTDPAVFGVKTFRYTCGPEVGTEYLVQIGDDERVPFTACELVGQRIHRFSDLDPYAIVFNDGDLVRILGGEQVYFSSDAVLTGPASAWTFRLLSDGQIIDQTCPPYFSVDKATENGPPDMIQKILVDIQDVTVPHGTFSRSVIFWYLDMQSPFKALDLCGRDDDLGITLPQGLPHAVTHVDIFARNVGPIASGDIDADSGALIWFAEWQ
jgi:hypothetical protein